MNLFFSVHAKTMLAISTAILISACGGNNDNQSLAPNAVAIPESITISAPPVADLADALEFTNSASSQSGLKFAWNFGDGTSSNEAAPKHNYSKVGDYEVSLIVSNAAGNSKESKIKISVNNLAGVRGLVCSGASDTGWCWQEPKPSGNWTNAFTLVNATTGWRIGDAGDIFKTQDGGVSWQRQQSGVSVNLYQIHTYDDKIAWVIGANKTLLHTLDGGASWKELVSPVDVSSRFETDIVTVISAKSLLFTTSTDSYLTVDSGLTWDKLTSPFNSKTGAGIIYGVRDSYLVRSTFENRNVSNILKLDDGAGRSPTRVTIGLAGENVVLVRGRTPDLVATNVTYYGKSLAWRSEDAGEHWTPYTVVGLPVGSENSKLYSLDKDGKVWLTQSAGGTYRSDDGGLSWREQESLRYGYGGPEDLGLQFVLVHGSRIFLISGWYGWNKYSNDFGKTWTAMKLPVVGESTISTIVDAKLVNGVLILWDLFRGRYVSTDYGDNWKQVVVENRINRIATYHAVAFVDAMNGVAVDTSGNLKSSNDGGKTWKLRDRVFSDEYRNQPKMQFTTPATAYILWQNGLIYKSRDGGATWLSSGPFEYVTNFGFFDEYNGWAQTGLTTSPISITRDGGASWQNVPARYPINSVWLDNTSTLTIASDAGHISQLNSTGWEERQTGSINNLRKLYSFDTKTMWAIGDKATVLRSDDAGLNWKTVPVPGQVNLTDIQFVDAKNGWIVGQKGFILVTQDGGTTWKQQVSGTNVDLLKVQFVDIKTGWIIGADSTLLATGTGGF